MDQQGLEPSPPKCKTLTTGPSTPSLYYLLYVARSLNFLMHFNFTGFKLCTCLCTICILLVVEEKATSDGGKTSVTSLTDSGQSYFLRSMLFFYCYHLMSSFNMQCVLVRHDKLRSGTATKKVSLPIPTLGCEPPSTQ